MHRNKRLLFAFAVGVIALTAGARQSVRAQSPSSFTVTDLGVLSGNASFKVSRARAINNSGTIIGSSYKDEQAFNGYVVITNHAVQWDASANIFDIAGLLFPAPDYNCNLFSINDAGEMVGTIGNNTTYQTIPYLFHPDGTSTPLAVPAGANANFSPILKVTNSGKILGSWYKSDASGFTSKQSVWDLTGARTDLSDFVTMDVTDINDAGTLVGSSGTPAKPYLWDSTNGLQALPFSGTRAIALAINNSGLVGGTADGHAVVWQSGAVTDLHRFGSSSRLYALNNAGQGLVSAAFPGGYFLNCFYNGVQIVPLVSMVPVSSPFKRIEAYGINDKGQIVGIGYNSDFSGFVIGEGHAVLLTPSDAILSHPSDISSLIRTSVARLHYNPTTKMWDLKITLKNTSGHAITGPLYAALNGVSIGSTGRITSGDRIGSFYWTVPLPASGKLGAGKSAVLTFSFSLLQLPALGHITVSAVLAGTGRP